MFKAMDDSLPNEVPACHELIGKLRGEIQQLRRKLAVLEENERQVFHHIYGPGATPESLLNFGLLMAGKEPLIRSSDPNNPTVGEVYARERAERRRQESQRR